MCSLMHHLYYCIFIYFLYFSVLNKLNKMKTSGPQQTHFQNLSECKNSPGIRKLCLTRAHLLLGSIYWSLAFAATESRGFQPRDKNRAFREEVNVLPCQSFGSYGVFVHYLREREIWWFLERFAWWRASQASRGG